MRWKVLITNDQGLLCNQLPIKVDKKNPLKWLKDIMIVIMIMLWNLSSIFKGH